MRALMRRLAVWASAPYYCRYCGAGPFTSESEGAAHSLSAHGES